MGDSCIPARPANSVTFQPQDDPCVGGSPMLPVEPIGVSPEVAKGEEPDVVAEQLPTGENVTLVNMTHQNSAVVEECTDVPSIDVGVPVVVETVVDPNPQILRQLRVIWKLLQVQKKMNQCIDQKGHIDHQGASTTLNWGIP